MISLLGKNKFKPCGIFKFRLALVLFGLNSIFRPASNSLPVCRKHQGNLSCEGTSVYGIETAGFPGDEGGSMDFLLNTGTTLCYNKPTNHIYKQKCRFIETRFTENVELRKTLFSCVL
jgi:hypothetical protein